MKALKAIKKIAAAGLGFAFIGATIGGAMATDLGDYPAPFATGSGYNGKIIVGEKASAIDIVGAVNIASSFTNLEGAGSVIVETPEGKVVNAVAFDKYEADGTTSVDEMPMKGEDRKLDFDEDDVEWAFMQGYENDDITETLDITITADVGDDDCEPDDETIKIDGFVYTFTDSSDGVADEIDDVEDDDDFTDGDGTTYAEFKYSITLFGKDYYVINDKLTDGVGTTGYSDTAGTLDPEEINYDSDGDGIPDYLRLQLAYADETVQTGDEIDLTPYGYDGYTLKIVRIAEESSGADADTGKLYVALMKNGVEVDDTTIDEPTQGGEETEKLKDEDEDIEVEVTLTDVYWDASTSEYFAEIRFETGNLKEGEFFDENEKWKLEDLTVDTDTDEVIVTVKYYSPKDDLECELEDNELYLGNTLSLLGYLELGFTGLSEPNTAEVDIMVDSEGKLIIDPDDSVEVEIGTFDGKGSKMEFEFYENATAAAVSPADDDVAVQGWKLVKFEGEKDEDVEDAELYLVKYTSTYDFGTSSWSAWAESADEKEITLYLDDENEYTIAIDEGTEIASAIGDRLDRTDDVLLIAEPDMDDVVGPDNYIEIHDLAEDDWDGNVYEDDDDDLTTAGSVLKEGDKTDLGTELVMYDSYDREATFSIVSDAIRYLVYAGQNVQSEGNEVELDVGDQTVVGKVVAVGAKPLPVGLAILDSELSSPDAVKDDNYIVVGGPCANSAAAALMGIEDIATCDQAFADEGYSAGEAVIKLYEDDGNFQLLVAGYNGEDTLLATEVLASYDKFKDEFEGKKEVKVKGTALADVEIEG